MPKLGDFLGTLLSDVAGARAHADLAAIKIAESYRNHDLLKYMPIPRFRLPDISVELPVIVTEIRGLEEGEGPGTAGTPFSVFGEPKRTELTRIVRRSFAEAGIRLPATDRKKVYSAVYQKARVLFAKGPAALLNSQKLLREISGAAVKATTGVIQAGGGSPDTVRGLNEPLKEGLSNLFLTKLLASPSLQVRVASSEIKEHADNESILRIRLSISEDAYELVREEVDGEVREKLVPE